MSGSRLLRGGLPCPCSLINPRKDLVTPKSNFQQLEKPGSAPAPAAAPAAPVAFATDDFADLVWPSNEGTISAQDEEAEVLNDLLHLGLELGDLECVFGDTDCAPTSDISSSSSVDDGASAGDAEGDEEGTIAVAEEGVEQYFIEGFQERFDAPEEVVLLDADLQDALLFLEDLEPEPIEDNPLCADSRVLEKSIDYSTCGSNTSDDSDGCCSHDTVGCWAFDRTLSGPLTPSAGEINAAASVELCNTPPPPSTTDAAAVSKDLGDGVKVLASPMDSYRRNTPGELIRGEDLLADIDASSAATGLHRQAAATDVAPAGTNSCPLAIEAEGIAAENSLPGSDGSSGSSSGGESEESGHVDGEGNVRASAISAGVVVDPAPAASTPTARAGAAVPTRLLDAIDLWESANAHSIAKKKAAAIAAAAAAREHARSTRAERSSNTGSTAKNKSKKKKNEFGKRRRSSGGGDQGAPLLETPRTGVAGASAGKAKGKGNGRGKGKEKGKKVDPLVRIRDARQLSRKPLIVQWLKSDGCDSDEEAEAALGKAVGSLSAISRYWGGGG